MQSQRTGNEIQSKPYQNATTAWDDVSSVPAATVLVSGLQATDRMGTFCSVEAMSCQRLRQNQLGMYYLQPYELACIKRSMY